MLDMKAPDFRVVRHSGSEIDLEYHSSRHGLASMVTSLLSALVSIVFYPFTLREKDSQLRVLI